ncbi:MAG TPA: NADH-quinone oxidoreductase subunit NuoH [Dehalococcoidia bacterium]|nr:NADH-quinone oxidoreductase subunit NuoH [Dehalococcoidia bacterium]
MTLLLVENVWLDALLRMAIVGALVPVGVIMLTWVERKVIGRLQQRLGPMRVGPYGLLQGIADTIKLITKEDVRPTSADRLTFELAVFVIVVPVFMAVVALPFTADIFIQNMALGLFYILAVSGLGIVGFVMAGWGSDNKYALLGGVRAGAQLISYEIPLILAAVSVAMLGQSLNLYELVALQDDTPYIAYQPLAFVVFMIAGLAELYRQPFDIPIAESEVVGGPSVEYSGIRWSMFQMGEFVSLVLISVLASLIFLGGWIWPFSADNATWLQVLLMVVKTSIFILFFMWMRASLPRLRIDQLMVLCWQILLPFTFLQIIINGLVLVYDWPDWSLTALSGLALIAMGTLIYQTARRSGVMYQTSGGIARVGSVL